MPSVIYGKRFIKSVKRLPTEIFDKVYASIEILKNNPFDSRLHTKPLHGKIKGMYSLRVTREWRVIFEFTDNNIIEIDDIGHRKDIYKKI